MSVRTPKTARIHRGIGPWSSVFGSMFWVWGCADAPNENPSMTKEAPARSAAPVVSMAQTAIAAPRVSAEPTDFAGREKTWDTLFSHIAARCYVDELAPTNYAVQWLNHHLPRDQAPTGAPWPVLEDQVFPAPGTPKARARALDLRKDWLGTPRSHVVDCFFEVPQRGRSGGRSKHQRRALCGISTRRIVCRSGTSSHGARVFARGRARGSQSAIFDGDSGKNHL